MINTKLMSGLKLCKRNIESQKVGSLELRSEVRIYLKYIYLKILSAL